MHSLSKTLARILLAFQLSTRSRQQAGAVSSANAAGKQQMLSSAAGTASVPQRTC
jgi:hypothetical protein